MSTLKEVRILLRDRNPPVVEAWKRNFAGIEQVEPSCGDIFDLSADAVVSPANSFGFMDGGIDLALSRYFGWDLQDRLQELLRAEHDGELPVGQAAIVETHHAKIPWCISAPTMRVPMIVAETHNAYLAFRAVLRAVREHNRARHEQPIRSILCSGLGTAVGQMPAERCARQMAAAYAVVALGQIWRFDGLGSAVDVHHQLLR